MISRRARTASSLAGLVLTSVTLAACGSTSTVTTVTDSASTSPPSPPAAQTSTSSAASSAGPVQVTISSPAQGATVSAAQVDVRGTVSPASASVEVDGQAAQVGNGVYSASVSLNSGQNSIDVIASAPGSSPGSTSVEVTRSTPAAPKPAPKPEPTHTTTVVDTTTTEVAAPAPTPSEGDDISCGGGLMVNSATSCPFARNTEDVYSGYGPEYVYSPVTDQSYEMDCEPDGAEVLCTGGNDASVMFP